MMAGGESVLYNEYCKKTYDILKHVSARGLMGERIPRRWKHSCCTQTLS